MTANEIQTQSIDRRIFQVHLAWITMLANVGRSQLRINRRAKQWQPMRFQRQVFDDKMADIGSTALCLRCLYLTNDFTGSLRLTCLTIIPSHKQWEAVFVVVWQHEESEQNCNKKRLDRPIDIVCAHQRPYDERQPSTNRFICSFYEDPL